MFANDINNEIGSEISKVDSEGKAVEDLNIPFTILAIIYTRIFLICTLFAGFTSVIEFLL
jgi:hypothetical protein